MVAPVVGGVTVVGVYVVGDETVVGTRVDGVPVGLTVGGVTVGVTVGSVAGMPVVDSAHFFTVVVDPTGARMTAGASSS